MQQYEVRAAQSQTGLYFDASHAHAADVLRFDLSHIASVYERNAPSTWKTIQILLNVSEDPHRHT